MTGGWLSGDHSGHPVWWSQGPPLQAVFTRLPVAYGLPLPYPTNPPANPDAIMTHGGAQVEISAANPPGASAARLSTGSRANLLDWPSVGRSLLAQFKQQTAALPLSSVTVSQISVFETPPRYHGRLPSRSHDERHGFRDLVGARIAHRLDGARHAVGEQLGGRVGVLRQRPVPQRLGL